MRYEEAREELVQIVKTLESGEVPLEESLELWERGEELARYCEKWLTDAREKLENTARASRPTADVSPETPEP